MLSRESILAADDLPREEVSIPEWNGTVFVQTMTGTERDRLEAAYNKEPGKDFRARMAVATVCDETGKRLFSEKDILPLGTKSAAALDRILEVAMRLSAFTKKDVDALEGNSNASPSEDSASSSH
ncbi:hypothetical protein SAMN05444166_6279 [Singulisphaera sp. GP187]|uniref:hypothetical protein n=1 Tax=Singulisphaera sp. GP187 TaxID=1882752 RepID=UPI000926AE34|nr:hypothetical protein [Singulisphaera sp. GP187]SIO60133.1 hypothetical protein SAMN05444166_6279 [Singulisphaera sp. GP187]